MKTVFVKPNPERAKAVEAMGYEFHVKDPETNRPIMEDGQRMEASIAIKRLIRCGDLIEATLPRVPRTAPKGGDK